MPFATISRKRITYWKTRTVYLLDGLRFILHSQTIGFSFLRLCEAKLEARSGASHTSGRDPDLHATCSAVVPQSKSRWRAVKTRGGGVQVLHMARFPRFGALKVRANTKQPILGES